MGFESTPGILGARWTFREGDGLPALPLCCAGEVSGSCARLCYIVDRDLRIRMGAFHAWEGCIRFSEIDWHLAMDLMLNFGAAELSKIERWYGLACELYLETFTPSIG